MTQPAGDRLVIRGATADDGPSLGDVWLSSWRATLDFPPSHPDEEVRHWLATEMLPSNEVWVASDPAHGGRVVAFMALSDTKVEHLYVVPDWIGHGLGRRFVELARTRRPAGLDLWCFQANARARRFYERNAFVPVRFGDGASNEERQPDILYRWRAEGGVAPAEPPG